MKKIVAIGIVAMMLLGMGVAANASATDWILILKASSVEPLLMPGVIELGIAATAATPTFFGGPPASPMDLIYCVDADPAKYGNKDIRAAGQNSYTWNMKVFKGSRAVSSNMYIGWNFPNVGRAPTAAWTFIVYRSGAEVASFTDLGTGYSGNWYNLLDGSPFSMAVGTTEDWQIVASQVPEPSGILALLGGVGSLIALAGTRMRANM